MFKLVLKDIKANKDIILLRIILPTTIISILFGFKYTGWEGYIMFYCITAIFSSSFYNIRDKNKRIELLTCSLPVSRNKIVYSKYLSALILSYFIIILGCINAYIADLIWIESSTNFGEIFKVEILITVLFLISIYFSLFLPTIFIFRQMGVIISLIISLVFSIYLTQSLLISNENPLNIPIKIYLDPSNFVVYILLFIVFIILPAISIIISKHLYKMKDLQSN